MTAYVARTVLAEDGTPVEIRVPDSLPDEARAEQLCAAYRDHIRHETDDWKGPAWAVVPRALEDDMAEAMEFMGSIVDIRVGAAIDLGSALPEGAVGAFRALPDGYVGLFSRGDRAHGF